MGPNTTGSGPEKNMTELELDDSNDEDDDNLEPDADVLADSSNSDSDSSADEETDESDPQQQELYGIKHRCPLNILKAFHSTSGFPVDILHDIFEGVVSQDLLGIIRILKAKGWFSVKDYNANMKNLKYKSYEGSDKPENVPESMKVKKLIGKAVSNWTHMRNFPLLIRKFVRDKDDPALALSLQLHEIVERITAN